MCFKRLEMFNFPLIPLCISCFFNQVLYFWAIEELPHVLVTVTIFQQMKRC